MSEHRPQDEHPESHDGVGTDGSLQSTHDREDEEHEGIGTDGSLHSADHTEDDNRSD